MKVNSELSPISWPFTTQNDYANFPSFFLSFACLFTEASMIWMWITTRLWLIFIYMRPSVLILPVIFISIPDHWQSLYSYLFNAYSKISGKTIYRIQKSLFLSIISAWIIPFSWFLKYFYNKIFSKIKHYYYYYYYYYYPYYYNNKRFFFFKLHYTYNNSI